MKDIDILVCDMAELIFESSEDGITFKIDAVEREWREKNNGMEFKAVFNKLISRNQVGVVAKNIGEIRDAERTD
ncbi:hypothetical protein ACJJH9_04485 [Microbulbifer sp. DLAB2-AF]|uniref:hypothetical protein n=1 Tax=Microbulbifer sp. DLAB2-AF TaxID=3243395 RepID=UPI0040395930